MEDPFVTIGFSSVTEGGTNQEGWRAGFSSVIDGATI
jgi:hypothetical protein